MSKNNHELDKARFDEPLRKNYDYGEGFYQNIQDYKSVADFLKKRKKKKKIKKANLKLKILKSLMKLAIDFPLDDSIKNPIETESTNALQALPFGGVYDNYFSLNDEEDKNISQLNLGRDYENDAEENETIEDFLAEVDPSPSPLLGLPDGIDEDEKTADKTISNRSQNYGTTDSGNRQYDNISL